MTRREWDAELVEAWGDWIASQGEWNVFGGLTYDPRRRMFPRRSKEPIMPGHDVVLAHARQWLQASSRRLGRPIEAGVIAVEHHKNLWPHLHPLLRVAGGLQGDEFAVLGQTWYKRHGYAKLEEPQSAQAVSEYAAKYLVKDLARGDVLFWPLSGRLDHQEQAPVQRLAF